MTLDEALEVIAQQQGLIETLRHELRAAQERIAQLEQVTARQAAPFRRDEQKKIPPEQQKRPGRKPGHPGAMRARPPQIDVEIDAALPPCWREVSWVRGRRLWRPCSTNIWA